MNGVCTTPTPLADLLAWWLGEADEASRLRLEDHLFDCGACAARLEGLVRLAAGIRSEFREGRLGTVLTAASVDRIKESGMRVREYRLQPGESVNCTVAPDDDLVVAHLRAPLDDLQRLDLRIHAGGEGAPQHLSDVPFDATAGEVVLASSVEALRKLAAVTLRAELIAVSDEAERSIGQYIFHHSPWRLPP